MKSKRVVFLVLILALVISLIIIACLVFSEKILFSEDYHASTGYQIWIGDEIPDKLPIPGAVVISQGMRVEDNDLNRKMAMKIANLNFTFSPTPKLQARFHPGTILYGERLDETGNTHSYWYVSAKVELTGKVLTSFPRETRYVPIDEQEFCELLTKEIQSRIGSDVDFTVINPELLTTSAFWGEEHWQLKKLPK